MSAIALKWPNDVLLNGGKVAGILLERGRRRGDALAIGIGVNLAAAPSAEEVEPGAVPPSLKAETGVDGSRPRRSLTPRPRLSTDLERTFATYGFAHIRARWLARAARLGEVITARLPARRSPAASWTVDEAGNLATGDAHRHAAIAAAGCFF
jgi:BirA family biotin operon repressor/biotin-[acetyl-CoA-carboxylase] ligase